MFQLRRLRHLAELDERVADVEAAEIERAECLLERGAGDKTRAGTAQTDDDLSEVLTVRIDGIPTGATLTNTYLSGYRDQNVPGLAAPDWNNRSVEAYSLWDLTGSYQINKQVRLRAGVINLLDTAPPFTNQSRYFQVTWDPTYGDPRGRTLFASVNVSLR